MNNKSKTGLEILQAALLLGILGDVLLRQTPWGLNVLLFVLAIAAASIMLAVRHKPEIWNAQTISLNLALVFFAGMFLWRDSVELQIFDGIAILTILAILMLPALNISTHLSGVFHYLVGAVWAAFCVSLAPLLLIFDDIKWKTIPQNGWSKHLVAVLRGLLIAAPLVFIFGILFIAADAVFERIVQQTLNIQPEIVLGHIFLFAFFSWITAGYLRGVIFEKNPATTDAADSETKDIQKPLNLSVTDIKEDEDPPVVEAPKTEEPNKWSLQDFNNSMLPSGFTLGAIEISVILGLINVLFLSFVLVQIPYLFGGMDLVQNTPDFKLAEYARRGFGELVIVSALVLPILLFSHWLLRKDNPVNEKIFRVFAGIQIVLLFIIMISATQRLLLLTGNLGYGLTTVRFYPMAVMVLLAMIFVWFGLTVMRGARERFAWGALWLTFLTLGTLHFLNPDDFIVRTNINLMREGRAFDASYNAQLSADAIPALLEGLPETVFTQRCLVNRKLLGRLNDLESQNDIRSWNLSRENAKRELSKMRETISAFTDCP